jgi:hypothetical protein
MVNNLEILSNVNNLNNKHLEMKNLNYNLSEIQRLYVNWNLDPGYKKNLEELELKYGLHDWAIWRTKINENLIITSLFNTPFILNQNNKSFVSQNLSNDTIDKENSETIQSRLIILPNENFSDHNFNFQIDPTVARFIYYYGFTKQKPLIDPESYMFYGIPRVKLNLLPRKDEISENIKTIIVNTKDHDNLSQSSQNNQINTEMDHKKIIEIEDVKKCLNEKYEFLAESQDHNLKIETKQSNNASITKNESYRLSSHPPKQLTIQTFDDKNKLSKVNSIKSNKSDYRVNSINNSIKNAVLVTPPTPNSRNLNRNNIFSNCPASIKAELKALRTNSEPAPIITGINVKEKVKAFESAAENNINKSTPIKGDKKISNDTNKTSSNLNLFDSKQSWSIIKNSRNVSLKSNSNEVNKLFTNNEQNQQNEQSQTKNDELSLSNMNIRQNTTTFVSNHQALVY